MAASRNSHFFPTGFLLNRCIHRTIVSAGCVVACRCCCRRVFEKLTAESCFRLNRNYRNNVKKSEKTNWRAGHVDATEIAFEDSFWWTTHPTLWKRIRCILVRGFVIFHFPILGKWKWFEICLCRASPKEKKQCPLSRDEFKEVYNALIWHVDKGVFKSDFWSQFKGTQTKMKQ